MPIVSNFPSGSGSGGGGLALAGVSGIATLTAHEKVYIQWTDPEDLVVAGSTLASWGGTLLVRKAGSMPTSRRDGVIVLDSKVRDAYKDTYFCDSGLTDGTTYYYKLFPYTTVNAYTDVEDGFSATPNAVALGDVSGITLAPAGNGKLSIKWTDPAATVVTDGVTLATWASTIVVVKAGSYATSPTDAAAAFTYTSTTRNGHATNALIATGLTNGTTYYVTLFPMSTDGKANTNAANRKTGVANRIVISSVPSQSGSLTYTGSSQTPVWSNYNSAQLTLGGTTSGTNAASYNATFTPKDDYMWPDGTITAKTVVWSIGKAAGSLTLSASSVTLNPSALSGTVTVTRPGDGVITATSSNTSVATATVSGTTVTINHVNQTAGTATITVKVAAGTNHTAPANKTISVTAQFVDATLNNNTWAVIADVSAKSQGANYWSVGDRKAVTLNGTVGTLAVNTTLYVYILGFDHNSAKEGKGIHFGTFKTALSGGTDVCLVDSAYNTNAGTGGTKAFAMNHWGSSSSPYNTNYGGWKGCDARYDILGSTKTAPSGYGSMPTTSRVGYDAPTDTATSPVANTLMAALPSDLRAVMKPITKYTDNKGSSSDVAANVTASVDYLPLLSECEIFGGSRAYANQYEKNYQAQYAYYSAGNSKVKYRRDSNSTAAYWWERSPSYGSSYSFCIVRADGIAVIYSSRDSVGLAPAFMV